MNKTISVIGCGWLGFPLAVRLVEQGYQVRGSSTSDSKISQLKEFGIEPYQIILHNSSIDGPIDTFLENAEVLIINIPPGLRRNPEQRYYDKLKLLHKQMKEADVPKVIFVSSTSVYGDLEGELNEETVPKPVTESARQLVASERLFLEDEDLKATVIRFGGLIGPNRHPVTRLSGKTNLKNGDDATNLIHLDDCIHMITTIVEKNWWNEIFNGVYPYHPRKADYYRNEALKRGLQPPEYSSVTGGRKGKIIKSRNFLINNEQFYTSI